MSSWKNIAEMSTKIPDGMSDWLDSIVLMRVTVADPEYIPEIDLLWSCDVAWTRLLLLPPSLVLASFKNASARAFCSRCMCQTSYPRIVRAVGAGWFWKCISSGILLLRYVSDFMFPDLSELFSVFVQGPPNCPRCFLVLSRVPWIIRAVLCRILPAKFVFCRMSFMGWLVRTLIVWAWKYGWSRWEVSTRA